MPFLVIHRPKNTTFTSRLAYQAAIPNARRRMLVCDAAHPDEMQSCRVRGERRAVTMRLKSSTEQAPPCADPKLGAAILRDQGRKTEIEAPRQRRAQTAYADQTVRRTRAELAALVAVNRVPP